MLLWCILLLPFVGSVCTAFVRPNARNAEAWLAGSIALISLALVVMLYPQVANGDLVRTSLDWLPQAGLEIGLRMDGFAGLFAALITATGALVILYARYYMSPADPVPRFFSFLLAFMGSMLGIVLSGNLIQLVVFWEMTSLTSFILIAYWYYRSDSRRGARMALTFTATGGLCLLAGVLMIGHIAGSYELDAVLAAGDRIRAHPWYPALLVCILLGIFTKSAQVPFQFWLPQAMVAPTPVSAYLHSATLVKAGVFLLARLWPALAGTDLWFGLVTSVGLASLTFGAGAALFQRDMKGVLAYSTVSHLGLTTLLLGMDSPLALVAAVFHMLNHATFKASLFMAAGIVDHETGTRDLYRLGGLSRAMPLTAALAFVSAAAMAGVPLLNGFLSKEMFFQETIFAGEVWPVRIGLPVVATLAGMLSVAYSVRFIHQVFYGSTPESLPRKPHDPTRWMLVPSALLVLACLLVGILPAQTVGPVLSVATHALLGSRTPEYSLSIWHGVTPPLLMSTVALLGGIAVYEYLHRSEAVQARIRAPLVTPRTNWFDRLNVMLVRTSDRVVRRLSSPRLQEQLVVIVCVCVGIAYLALRTVATVPRATGASRFELAFTVLWISGSACAAAAAVHAKFHRLAALIMLAGTGLVTCLTFAWFSAPDLALTQISAEIVTMVLLLLGLRWLPKRIDTHDPSRRTLRARSRRIRDAVLATLAGTGMATLTYTMLTHEAPPSAITRFFLEHSLLVSEGRNVVNVTLVDFRGFDTLGEITILSIVALTVYKVLRRFRPAPQSIRTTGQQMTREHQQPHPNPAAVLPQADLKVPAVLGRALLPIAAVISLFILLRGHNAPGGGFVGGLVLATAFIVQYLVNGTLWVESRLRIRPQYWIAAGLLSAICAGVGAWLGSRAFLTNLSFTVHVPLLGRLHFSTTLLFDLGVYLVVIGATTLILVALAHQSLRGHRGSPAAEAVAGIRVRA
jgi:multicomponent K+:H+ antiporter subunit A